MIDSAKFGIYAASAWLRTEILKLSPKPRSVAIFGSFARGCGSANDLDILLVGDGIPRRPFERAKWSTALIRDWHDYANAHNFPKGLSPLILSEQGWLDSVGLRLSLSEDALILWDDGFLGVSLSESREWIGKGVWHKRQLNDGGWIWIPGGKSA